MQLDACVSKVSGVKIFRFPSNPARGVARNIDRGFPKSWVRKHSEKFWGPCPLLVPHPPNFWETKSRLRIPNASVLLGLHALF